MAEPLTAPEIDLREFPYMPLDVVRLRDSDISVLSSGDEFRAAVLLWCASWHQVPAASLPNDDRLLANLAGYGRDLAGWQAIRDGALRGFILCCDGRLYHPVIAEKAVDAWAKKKGQTSRTAAATEARRNGNKKRHDERDDDRDDPPPSNRNVHQENREERRGEGEKISDKTPSMPPDGRAPASGNLEAQCREIFGIEPIVSHLDFTPITRLLAEGVVTEADVLTACRAVMADPSFRPTYWRQIVGWARRAAQDRLKASPKRTIRLDVVQMGIPDETYRAALDEFDRSGFWPPGLGPRPGHGGCLVPQRLLNRTREVA